MMHPMLCPLHSYDRLILLGLLGNQVLMASHLLLDLPLWYIAADINMLSSQSNDCIGSLRSFK